MNDDSRLSVEVTGDPALREPFRQWLVKVGEAIGYSTATPDLQRKYQRFPWSAIFVHERANREPALWHELARMKAHKMPSPDLLALFAELSEIAE